MRRALAAAAVAAIAAAACTSFDPSGIERDAGAPDAPGGDVGSPPADAAPPTDWVIPLGGAMDQVATAVVVGRGGAVYVAGTLKGSVTIGGAEPASAGGVDVFLARVAAADGAVLWARVIGGTRDEGEPRLAVEPSGDLVVVGTFQEVMTLESDRTLTSAGGTDAFVIRFRASDGGVVWARAFGGAGADRGTAVAVDGMGVLVAGSFSGSADLGGGVVASAGKRDLFLTRLTLDGFQDWAIHHGGPEEDEPRALALDAAHDVFVAGVFQGTASFGGAMLTGNSTSTDDILLAKYAGASGGHIWSQSRGGPDADAVTALVADGAGGFVAAGSFTGDVDLGGGVLANGGVNTTDAFVARYRGDGLHLWSRSYGGVGDDEATGLALAGALLVTGLFESEIDLGGGPLAGAGGTDGFYGRLAVADGSFVAGSSFGGPGDEAGFDVDGDAAGRSFVAGVFQMSCDFGFTSLTSGGGKDGFLLSRAP